MKPSEALLKNRAAIRRVVESHRAKNARVFGSVVHGGDTEDSDLDLLVDSTAEPRRFRFNAAVAAYPMDTAFIEHILPGEVVSCTKSD